VCEEVRVITTDLSGATIGQGLVFGRIIAEHAARAAVPV